MASCLVGWFLSSFAYKFQVFSDLTSMVVTVSEFTVPDAIKLGIMIWELPSCSGYKIIY